MNNEELYFTDREKEFDILDNAFNDLMKNNEFFKVFSLYGIGGIGKSRFINHSLKASDVLSHQNLLILNINLEIVKSDNILNAIFGLRKQIPTTCPLFDYAIMNFWNKYSPSEFNTEFSKTILEQCLGFFSEPVDFAYKNISVLSLANKMISLLRNAFSNSMYEKEIENLTMSEFIEKLPEFIGTDIRLKYFDKFLVLFIDAYEQYETNWIENLISNIGYGVFIVASREKLHWDISVEEIRLPSLPEIETNKLLDKYGIQPNLRNNIIQTTDCVPIYLDLAIQSVKNNKNQNSYYFTSKQDIVAKFFDHLNKEIQETLIALSIIQIFNKEIFMMLIKELNIPIPILEYFKIIHLSIINDNDELDGFYKVHDVVSENVRYIYSSEYRKCIFDSYIRVVHKCTFSDIEKIFMYKHILHLFIINNFTLDKATCEIMLDLFFNAKGTLLPINYSSLQSYDKNFELKPIYFFTKAIYNERNPSKERFEWLELVENPNIFGKHLKSYKIIYGYIKGLLQNQSELFNTLDSVNEFLTINELNEWYYGQTKIFLGDYYVTQGDFNCALSELSAYKKLLTNTSVHYNNHLFQVNRHLGHMYRFNLFCEEAMAQYQEALDSTIEPSELQKLYIYTNFAETTSLFNHEFLKENYCIYLQLCKKYNDLKSLAKIYNSVAILFIKNNNFKRARKFLRKSIYLNNQDGYISGIVFAYLNFLILEKKAFGTFSERTLRYFQEQLSKIKRYSYLELPIFILNNDIESINRVKNEFNWIDFDRTIAEYLRFFRELGL